ncbi:hypothetical protein HDU93_001708 [Gonapodya sp. JEL0774]|nr:hypothetical protein HDU93_001708 [Gonapodya sp. JEL0774]
MALEGVAETVIVWEGLTAERWIVRDAATGEESVRLVEAGVDTSITKRNEALAGPSASTTPDLEIVSQSLLVDWLAESHKELGCSLVIVTDKTPEGTQFVKGFGGIGAVLRYKVDLGDEDDVVEFESDEEDV